MNQSITNSSQSSITTSFSLSISAASAIRDSWVAIILFRIARPPNSAIVGEYEFAPGKREAGREAGRASERRARRAFTRAETIDATKLITRLKGGAADAGNPKREPERTPSESKAEDAGPATRKRRTTKTKTPNSVHRHFNFVMIICRIVTYRCKMYNESPYRRDDS